VVRPVNLPGDAGIGFEDFAEFFRLFSSVQLLEGGGNLEFPDGFLRLADRVVSQRQDYQAAAVTGSGPEFHTSFTGSIPVQSI
jgi:hypothetical protein